VFVCSLKDENIIFFSSAMNNENTLQHINLLY